MAVEHYGFALQRAKNVKVTTVHVSIHRALRFRKSPLKALVAAGASAFATTVCAEEPDESATALTKEEFAARHAGLSASDIHDGPIAGVWEVVTGGEISYVTDDGRFLIRGDIIELDSERNVTEARRAENRAAMLAAIDHASEIVFSPENGEVRHRIFVFTDVDCGYCRQFHREVALVNALGIEVHYVSYPRTGPDSESWTKAENVWCSSDRQSALTQAKLGASIPAVPECTANPVATHFNLGRRVGLTGTPAIYAESGVELGGYLPPDILFAALEKLTTETTTTR